MSTSDAPPLLSPGRPAKVQRQTMAGQVAADLRQRILSGELKEGVQLRQEQLAAEFGISKVPVREALHQLEAEGFITQQFHRGAVVAGLSPDEIAEVFELRALIEVWLLELAMQAATDQDVANVRRANQMIEESKDPADHPELNWRFHEAMYRPSQKHFAIEHLRKLYTQIERYVRLQFSLAQNKETVMRQHNELLDLYAKKDPAALKAMRKHIIGSADELAERLQAISEGRGQA